MIGVLVLLCLVAGEVFIRVFLKTRTVYDVEMARYSLELKKDSPDPRIGHVHRPDKSLQLMGVQVRTNSEGLRDREHTVARGPERRIALLGDSLTLGWGVEEGDSFKSLLEEKLNRITPTEILNFGAGNYNTEQEVHLFLERGLKYRPDKVVVFYFINDAEITPRKSRWWFMGYSQLATLYWSRGHLLAERLFPSRGGYQAYYASLYQKNNPGLSRAQDAFLLLQDVCRKNHIELQVVLLPELHELVRYPFQKEHQMIADFLRSHHIDVLDLAPRFSGIVKPMDLWVARDDAHPNKEGHRLIAEHSWEFINGSSQGTK